LRSRASKARNSVSIWMLRSSRVLMVSMDSCRAEEGARLGCQRNGVRPCWAGGEN
jgi:hypothetical protein